MSCRGFGPQLCIIFPCCDTLGVSLSATNLPATHPTSVVKTVTSIDSTGPRRMTRRAGLGLVLRRSRRWRLVWRTSLCTSLKLLMADPAGAGMTGIKFEQKGLFTAVRALSGPQLTVAILKVCDGSRMLLTGVGSKATHDDG